MSSKTSETISYLARENRYWAQLTLQSQYMHMSSKTSETISYIKKDKNNVNISLENVYC